MTDFEFQHEHDGSLSREAMVMQAIGAASMCWEHVEDAGVFQSEKAKEIGDKLLAALDAAEPLLGYATTRQLLDEITARIDVDGANGGGGLDYRTVGSR